MDDKDSSNNSNVETKAIGVVAKELGLPTHVLRFWETQFPEYICPQTGAGNRRYYSARDINILQQIKHFLYEEGYSIRGLRKKFVDEKVLEQWQQVEVQTENAIMQHLDNLDAQLDDLEHWLQNNS